MARPIAECSGGTAQPDGSGVSVRLTLPLAGGNMAA
jgi:hypothetical protein